MFMNICDVFKENQLPDEKSLNLLCRYFASGTEIRGPYERANEKPDKRKNSGIRIPPYEHIHK